MIRDNFFKRIIGAKIILFLGLLILVFIGAAFFKIFFKAQKVRQGIENLENQIVDLKSQNQQLSELIKYLNSPAFMEERARLDLGLKKPEESVLIVPANLNLEEKNSGEPLTIAAVSNFWKWLNYIFSSKSN